MIQIMLSSLRMSSIIHVKSNWRKEYKTHTHTHTRECSIKGKNQQDLKDLTPSDVQDDRPDGRLGTHIPPWLKYRPMSKINVKED